MQKVLAAELTASIAVRSSIVDQATIHTSR